MVQVMIGKKVSIIIPTYNRLSLLERALDSIYKQSYKNWEIIIIDNFSSDGTKLFIEELNNDNIKFKQYNNNGIIGSARNIGINLAQGAYLAFLDSDDWWEAEKLEQTVLAMESSNSHIVYHNCYIKGETVSTQTYCRKLKFNAYDDLLINGNTLVTSSVLAKKKSVMDVGGFSECKLRAGWEDYDLWIKLSKKNYKFEFLNNKLGYYWVGNDNFDNPERILLNIERIKQLILKKYIDKSNKNPWWPAYTEAIAYFDKRDYSLSIYRFSSVIISKSPISNKLKSIFYLIKIMINCVRK
jgi:glycosyltransferase involved in cell wall biosynthesis